MNEIHIFYSITDEMVDVLLKFNNDFINNLNKALSSFGYSIKIDRLNTDVNGTSPLNDD